MNEYYTDGGSYCVQVLFTSPVYEWQDPQISFHNIYHKSLTQLSFFMWLAYGKKIHNWRYIHNAVVEQ